MANLQRFEAKAKTRGRKALHRTGRHQQLAISFNLCLHLTGHGVAGSPREPLG